MVEESELYAAARAAAISDRSYSLVKKTAEYSLEFAKKYLEEIGKGSFSEETKNTAAEFHNVFKGITELIEPKKIPDSKVMEYYAELKKNIDKLLEQYYGKYKRKIEKGYFQEYVENAREDLINVYKAYCLNHGITFDESSPEIITEIEKIVEQIRQNQSSNEER